MFSTETEIQISRREQKRFDEWWVSLSVLGPLNSNVPREHGTGLLPAVGRYLSAAGRSLLLPLCVGCEVTSSGIRKGRIVPKP